MNQTKQKINITLKVLKYIIKYIIVKKINVVAFTSSYWLLRFYFYYGSIGWKRHVLTLKSIEDINWKIMENLEQSRNAKILGKLVLFMFLITKIGVILEWNFTKHHKLINLFNQHKSENTRWNKKVDRTQ